jgi:hypothetical protein
MTYNPRLPTLEAIMNGNNPYELVDSPFAEGKMEAWRAQSLALGASGALAAMHRLYQLVRNDAADAARADEAQAREALVQHLCDQVAAMQERINRLADALEERWRSDEEAARHQRRFDEEPLTLPPDIAEYQASTPPAKIGDDTHQPGGELHAVAPKSELPEPPLETEGDEVGDLPKELEDPPDLVPEPRGSVVQQPTAISLNKE